MKSLGGGNKAIDTIKSPHKRETFYEIRNIAHKKENKENIKERLFSQPLPEGRGSHADSQLESRLPQETEDEPYLRRSEQDGFLGISRAGEFVL